MHSTGIVPALPSLPLESKTPAGIVRARRYRPSLLGLEVEDLWDAITWLPIPIGAVVLLCGLLVDAPALLDRRRVDQSNSGSAAVRSVPARPRRSAGVRRAPPRAHAWAVQ